jgi:DNA-binding response OmpR family regulator
MAFVASCMIRHRWLARNDSLPPDHSPVLKPILKNSKFIFGHYNRAAMPIHRLGPFRLDTQHDLLLREGAPVPLGRRAIALLRTLLEQPGTLISKDTLIEAAWSGRLVEESNLSVQIAALRRVLGEAPGGDHWIETMPGPKFVV